MLLLSLKEYLSAKAPKTAAPTSKPSIKMDDPRLFRLALSQTKSHCIVIKKTIIHLV